MNQFLKSILQSLVVIAAIAAAAKLTIPYFADITWVDYIAFTGAAAIGLGYITYDKAPGQAVLSSTSMADVDLARYDRDSTEVYNNLSFSLSVGIAGFLLLLISGLMVWLG
ncbi:hypothetical protein ACEQ8A_004459 [Vibrio fluvialis]|uniref:hypothetical protein n=1 Tax=Vibrio fluvialis TaxID=676 RepID=UPI00117D1D11|nr:hypothetical protein [Vibrio fluvialis]EKO3420859.1 hypothetical protein [Vibrio fluvialis]EKO3423890.1 hypothetical protein [Vibrio fluvialis]EKO3436196.1 hypothetical protein [Vibrio fluvialis]EKO3442312.1 hypothetical protein [Vibrio fluvialis]EKO3445181.1 hypothetical protein [Vibrio fluvialis]